MEHLLNYWISSGIGQNAQKSKGKDAGIPFWLFLNCPDLQGYSPPGKKICPYRVIGVDGGWNYACKAGLNPEFLIGDGDSLSLTTAFPQESLRFPSEKDFSDFEGVLKFLQTRVLGKPMPRFRVTGLFGGRQDHVFFNIRVLFSLRTRNPVFLDGPDYRGLFLPPGKYEIPVKSGALFSLLFSNPPSQIHLAGALYEYSEKRTCNHSTSPLLLHPSLFLSNRTTNQPLQISFLRKPLILFFPAEGKVGGGGPAY